MTDSQPAGSKQSILPIVIAVVGLLFGFAFLAVAAFFLLNGSQGTASSPTPTASGIPTRPVSIVTATFAPTDSPPPTPTVSEPTVAATTDEATDEPTATSAPAATNKPAATNPPPPTNPPPTETTAPSSRILNPAFSLEATAVPANQAIWFNFSVTNANPLEPLAYGALGAAIFDANGNNVHFQGSYTNASLDPGQVLNWRDHTAIGTPGTYSLRLAICYSYPLEACSQPGADWEMLSPPISVVIQ